VKKFSNKFPERLE